MANGRPSPAGSMSARQGNYRAQVDTTGMAANDPELLNDLTDTPEHPQTNIQVPDWMKKIGDMLSGKKKAPAAPAPAPTPPQSFTGAQVDSILNRNRSAGR